VSKNNTTIQTATGLPSRLFKGRLDELYEKFEKVFEPSLPDRDEVFLKRFLAACGDITQGSFVHALVLLIEEEENLPFSNEVIDLIAKMQMFQPS